MRLKSKRKELGSRSRERHAARYSAMRKWRYRLLQQVRQLLKSVALLGRGVWRPWISCDRVGTEAMRWVITLHSCSELEPVLPEFRAWLDRRPIHSERFARLWELWQELSELKDSGLWHKEEVPNAQQDTHPSGG